MGRRVFISVLGAGFYSKCKYVSEKISFKSEETRFIQTATLEYIGAKEWESNDVAMIILTNLARKQNWRKEITERFNSSKQIQDYEGLEAEVEKMNLPIQVKDISIPDGKDEEEMWQIFDILFAQLQDGDEVYFDLTHSFRYIPMLVLILFNYAKFLKNIKINSVSYGNYEAINEKSHEAPIIDLLPLSSLLDWTFAAGHYLDSGNVDKLISLSKEELSPVLKETQGKDPDASKVNNFIELLNRVVEEFKTCRGLNIIQSTNLSKLKAVSENLDKTTIKPLNPIFNKIKESIKSFDERENLQNAYNAAQWCFDNRLYQQAATILQEYVVSVVCRRNGIDISDEDKREYVNGAFKIKERDLPESEWKSHLDKVLLRKILTDDIFNESAFVKVFKHLSELRNDYNHSGMRGKTKPMEPKDIVKKLEQCLMGFKNLQSQG